MHTDGVESDESWVELPYNPQKEKKLGATCDSDISVSSLLFYGLDKVLAKFEQGVGKVLATSEQVFFARFEQCFCKV